MEELEGKYYELREMEREILWQYILDYCANKAQYIELRLMYVCLDVYGMEQRQQP